MLKEGSERGKRTPNATDLFVDASCKMFNVRALLQRQWYNESVKAFVYHVWLNLRSHYSFCHFVQEFKIGNVDL